MLKDITLGQYFPGDTVVHRLDPRTKLLMVIVYIVALFLAKWVISYAVMLAFLVTAVALSRIRPRALFKGLKPLLFIIIFTAIINVFYTKGDVLVQFWIFKITREGLVNAGFLVLRIVMLVSHRADRRSGVPALAAEGHPFPGARAGSHDEHCPALHPDAHRGDG